ncbi:50S ribosomal protein L18 [Betaproteobacteria bacterium]|nr:50S ribosomal protein L18 [Betaproteobacteria bacterium]
MKKKLARIRRSKSTRARIECSELPRLMVHRTNLHIYASVISPDKSKILVSVSTLESHMRDKLTGEPGRGGNKKAASLVGEMVGKKAQEKGIKKVAFDRSGFMFHGRVKALADAARQSGLEF